MQRAPALPLACAFLRWAWAVSLGLLCIAAPWPAHGQTQTTTVGSSGQPVMTFRGESFVRRHRLIRQFDFEERALGNYERMPMHWYAIGRPPDTVDPNFARRPLHQELAKRPGYPAYTEMGFDTRHRVSGEHSFMLSLDGGHVGAFLEVGAIATVPGSDYQITAQVRTTQLKYARARVVAYFVNSAGRRIDASVRTTPLVVSPDQWQSVSVRLSGDHPDAAWLGLHVEIVQPRAQAIDTLGPREIVYQDIHGSAWFDDLAIWQVPRVTIQTQNAVNVLRAPQPVRLRAQVQDLAGHGLSAELQLFDHNLAPVASLRQPVGDGAPMSIIWSPRLERYGWYLAQLTLFDKSPISITAAGGDGSPVVARSYGAFLYMPPDSPVVGQETNRFAIDATGVSDAELALLPVLMDQLRLGGLTLSCWSADTTAQTLDVRWRNVESVIDPLLGRGGQVTLNLAPLPDELAATLDTAALPMLQSLAQQAQLWRAFLAPTLMRQGQRVRQWQLGWGHDTQPFHIPDLSPVLSAIDAELSNLAPQPRLVLPWTIDLARRRDLASDPMFALVVPQSVRPQHLAAYATEWSDPPPAQFVLHLRGADPQVVQHQHRITDFALRMLHGHDAGTQGLALAQPWSVPDAGPPALVPDPLLGVFANIAHRLAGRHVVGRMALGPGLECWVLDGPAGGMLAAWNDAAPADQAALEMYLGGRPQTVDVWGNRSTVDMIDGRHVVPLTDTPVFIEGIDAGLALFRTLYSVEPVFFESTQKPQTCTVRIVNPWRRSLGGSIHLMAPESWYIEPRRTVFTISPGQTLEVPLEIRLPVSELAGAKRLVARLDLTADQHHRIDITTPLEVGLRGVQFDADLLLERSTSTGGVDAVVVHTITNISDRPLSLYAFANLAGFPRQERIVARLAPGESAVRRFRFTDATVALAQADLRVGIREVGGPAILNKALSLRGP